MSALYSRDQDKYSQTITNKKMVYVHEAVAGTYGVRGKSMLAPSAMMVVFVPAQLIRPGIER